MHIWYEKKDIWKKKKQIVHKQILNVLNMQKDSWNH